MVGGHEHVDDGLVEPGARTSHMKRFSVLFSGLLLSMRTLAAPLRHFDFSTGGNAAGHPAYDASEASVSSPIATRFSVRVPEGNYRVTRALRRRAPAADTRACSPSSAG